MKSRCNNPNDKKWPSYGGRGIKVCDRWSGEVGFENFRADMGEPPLGMTLDRKDVNGDYTPSNCRWATRSQQQRNRRVNHVLEYNGRKQTLTEWAEEVGIKPNTLLGRIRDGWSVSDAITTPILARRHSRKWRGRHGKDST